MTDGKLNFAWRTYRRLAQSFPHEFKLAYGADVMRLGEDSVRDIATRHGITGLTLANRGYRNPRADRSI